MLCILNTHCLLERALYGMLCSRTGACYILNSRMLTCWLGSTGFGLIVLCTWDFLLLGITIDVHLHANLEGLSQCSYASGDTQKDGLAFSFVSWKLPEIPKGWDDSRLATISHGYHLTWLNYMPINVICLFPNISELCTTQRSSKHAKNYCIISVGLIFVYASSYT